MNCDVCNYRETTTGLSGEALNAERAIIGFYTRRKIEGGQDKKLSICEDCKSELPGNRKFLIAY